MKQFLVLLLLAWQQPVWAQTCQSFVTGHVHSSAAHENLEMAVVQLQPSGKTLVTDANGNFRIDSLCPGTYELQVHYSGHEAERRSFSLDRQLHLDVDLKPLPESLSNVTVSAQRSLANSGLKAELSGARLEATRGLSLAEAMSRINGVQLLRTGSTISKPVVHGLHGNRLLLINNGVRQEGQQWGNEHAPEIDPFIASRITVIKGVDELRYGSDAVGGVILVDPRPLRSKPGYGAELNTVYFTNNRQYVLSGSYERQLSTRPALAYRLQGTLKKAANVATPTYRLNNTAFEEANFSAAAIWRKQAFHTELFYSFFQTRLGIFKGSHIGNTTDLERKIQEGNPDPTFTGQNSYRIERPMQDVQHQLLKSKTTLHKGSSRYHLQVSAQYNRRQEFDIVRNNSSRPQLDLSLVTLSQDLGWEQVSGKAFKSAAGISALQQLNRYDGRYVIPKYNAYGFGAYYIGKWSLNNWEAQAGLRYDNRRIATNRLSAGGRVFDVYNFDFSTAAASFNAGYRLNEHWKVNALFSLSSRAPQVNELLSNGIHHGSAVYEVGDINLKPEHSRLLSLNSNYANAAGTVKIDASIYRNSINQFIYLQPVPDSPVLTIAGAFPKRVFRQTDALLYGADFDISLQLHKGLGWQSRFSFLTAKDTRAGQWLILMPANRMQHEVNIGLPNAARLRNNTVMLQMVHVWQQSRVPSDADGKKDYSPPPPGYSLFNLQLGTQINLGNRTVRLSLTGHNLLNKRYREYLNAQRYFADEMGRDFSIRLHLPLENN